MNVQDLLRQAKADYEAVFGVKDESWWKGANRTFDVLKVAQMKLELLQLDYYERSLLVKKQEADRLDRRSITVNPC